MNPTEVSFFGRTAIGIACVNKHSEALELCLAACKNYESPDECGESEAKKWKPYDESDLCVPSDEEVTPEGMDDLQWEDEITQTHSDLDKEESLTDEWSALYKYYAKIIEKTGEILTTTISFREVDLIYFLLLLEVLIIQN